ncbi:MAG: site-specific integrase [Mycobacterium sp.]
MTRRSRRNGEGPIFPYRNGYAAYVWVTTPAGNRQRKYVYGKTREDVHQKWMLQGEARKGPVATSTPSVGSYLAYWLREAVEPNVAPLTASTYETLVRLYIVPGLGAKRLDRLQVREVQTRLNGVGRQCQCCAQGKDARRPHDKQRCCAVGQCCGQVVSGRTLRDLRTALRSALGNAAREELISKNVAGLVKLPPARKHRRQAWTVDEARQFLESARADGDPLYTAYVLILVLGLRKGEELGLRWEPDVNLDGAELAVNVQLQRVKRQLLHRETKTDASTAVLPMPDIRVAARRFREKRRDEDRAAAADAWQSSQLVFATRYGTPVEPRYFNRSWDARVARAGVRRITVHDARRSCASMLAALDVHPRVAMEVLRHAESSVTLEIYTVVSSQETREALKRLSDRLEG